jgi:hypothetical protein
MRFATLDDLREVARAMRAHEELRHVRQDKLRKRIEAGQCIYDEGVVITFQIYKKKTRVGNLDIPRGSVMLHQIVNAKQFSGAGGRVFKKFVEEIVKPSGGDVYLSVRKANTVACSFYERHGMEIVGKVNWSQKGSPLPGLVYKLSVASATLCTRRQTAV